MPFLNINGANIHHETTGTGEESIVFSHGLLMDHSMWDPQVEHFKNGYRCITYDHRGQGQSEVTESGYDMDSLTEDAAALIRELGSAPCHFVGLSMGGFVGLRLAIKYPELIRSLVLLDTSAQPEPQENHFRYRMLALIGRWLGFRPIAGRLLPILFGQTFLNDPAHQSERDRWKRHFIELHRVGAVRAARAVIDREGVSDQLGSISTPTLILVGDEDRATPLVKAQHLHDGISGSKLVVVKGAGHTSSLEQADFVTAELRRFFATA